MSKAKSKSGRRNSGKGRGFPPAETPEKRPASKISQSDKRPVRWGLVVLFLTIAIGGTYLAIWMRPKTHAPRYTYEVIKEYPHDANAFTQGLVVDDGFFWESTGRYGESTVRKTSMETGEEIKRIDLDKKYFGEGLTIHGDQLFQQT